MLIPIRCWTCGNVIGNHYDEWKQRVLEKGEEPRIVLDEMGLNRICCRRMLVSHVEILDETIKFALAASRRHAMEY